MNILEQSETLKDIPEQVLMKEMQMPSGSFPQYLVLTEIKRRKRIRDDFQRRQAQNVPTVAEEAVTAAGVPQEGIMQMSKAMAPKTNMGQNTGMADMMPKQPVMGMNQGGALRNPSGQEVLQRIINTLVNARPSERAMLRNQLVEAVGEDTVREAESMMLLNNESLGGITQMRMEKQGIFGSSPGRPQLTPEEPTFLPPPESTRQRGDLETGQLTSILSSDPVTQALAERSGVSVADYIAAMNPDTRAQELLRVSGQRTPTFDKDKDDAAYASSVDDPSIYNMGSQLPTQEDLDLKAASDTRNEAVGIGVSDVALSPVPSELGARIGALGGVDAVDRPDFLPSLGDPEVTSPEEAMLLSQSMKETAAGMEQIEPMRGLVTGLTPGEKFMGPGIVIGLTPGQKFQSESLNPLNIGPTELNQPAVRNALQGPDSAGLATALKNAAESGPQELTGTEQMAAFLEQENFDSENNVVQRLLDLGATPREVDGKTLYVLPTGAVYSADGKQVSGGEAMQAVDVAQKQGQDFTKSPLGQLPLGSYDTDAAGNTIPGTFKPLSIPIGGAKSPQFLEGIVGPESTVGNLLGVQNAPAPIPTSKPAPAKTPQLSFGAGTTGAGDLPLSSGAEAAATAARAQNVPVNIGGTTIKPSTTTKKSTTTAGAAGTGSLESRIAKAIADREKRAESDKWLALAQTGLIMASGDPADLSKAGQAGLKALATARGQKDKFDADMLGLQQRIDAYKARIAAAASSKKPSTLSASGLSALQRDAAEAAERAQENPSAANIEAAEFAQALFDNARTIFALQQGIAIPEAASTGRTVSNVSD
jgi:hypothetical protein